MPGMFEEEEESSCGWNRASKKAIVGDEVRRATGNRSSRAVVLKIGCPFDSSRSFKIILVPGLHLGQLDQSFQR